jgi:CHAT domain-containing protein
VEVFDPWRKILRVDALNGSVGPEDIPFVAESKGAYQVRVSSESSGIYLPRIIALRQATPRDRARAAAALAYYRAEEARKSNLAPQEVENDYLAAAQMAKDAGDRSRRADAFYRLCKLQCDQHRWHDCRSSCLRGLALYEDEKDLLQESITATQLGIALQSLGDQKGAFEAYSRAVQIARKYSKEAAEAKATLNLGLLEIEMGELEPALKNFDRARQLNQQLAKPEEEAKALNARGRVYTLLGEVGQAIEDHGVALKLLGGLDGKKDALVASTLVHIADAHREADSLPIAIAHYRRGIALFRKAKDLDGEARALNNLGLAYYHSERYREAIDAYIQALGIFHDQGRLTDEASCWVNIGWLQVSLNQIPKAIESLESGLSISHQSGRRLSEASAYFGMAWAERRRHNLIAAQRNVRQAISILESLRGEAEQPELRSSLLASRFNFYEFLVDILMEQHRIQPAGGHDAEAFEASEGARGRSLLESLGVESIFPALSLADIQHQVLDKETILLEYYLGDDRSALWVVSQESYASYELPGRSKIEPLSREVYDLLKVSHKREALPMAVRKARELAKLLLGPVAGRLGDKRLLIVAPPSLQYIPFAALPDPSMRAPEGSETSWPSPLMRRHEIVNAPSASVIAALRNLHSERKVARHLLAILADPVYEWSDARLRNAASLHLWEPPDSDPLAGRFKRLRYSRQEAEGIERTVGGRDILKLLDFSASRERFLKGDLQAYKYIHISAHGDSSPARPVPSIVLSAYDAKGRRLDPYLRTKDIQKLGLSANLVVLSACGSGLGQKVRGEGIVGLTQAFLSGGASGVLVSIWNVDDLAASEIMPLFYENLLKRGMKPSAAFRDAQISMWRQPRWNAPSYWAGFVHQGEWK